MLHPTPLITLKLHNSSFFSIEVYRYEKYFKIIWLEYNLGLLSLVEMLKKTTPLGKVDLISKYMKNKFMSY